MKHHFSLYTILLCVSLLLVTQQTSVCQRNKKLDSKNKPITYRLFMQNNRANIAFPANHDSDSTVKGHFISEQVTFKNEDNYSAILAGLQEEPVGESLDKVHALGDVVVTAKRHFVPERDGQLNINFLVQVPKELISKEWRLMLTPMILKPDSTIELGSIMLKGENFALKQESDSLKYRDYVASLVDEGDYVNMFLDSVNIRKDMDRQLGFFWDLYHKEWKQQNNYLKWEEMMMERYGRVNLKQQTALLELKSELRRKAWTENKRSEVFGESTAKIDSKYAKKFERKAKFWPKYRLKRELTKNKTPGKYRQYFGVDVRPENLANYVLTPADSAEIANNRYLYGAIAQNEQRIADLDKMHANTIVFPTEEGVHADLIASEGADFEYLYELSLPVDVGGGGDVTITMKGMIEAVDRSSYVLNTADTLIYMVSSLTQLVDATLVTKKTQFYRNMYDKITIAPKFKTESWSFDVNYMDNKEQMDSVLNVIEMLVVEKELHLDSLEIKMYSALNGTFNTNANLTINRSDAIKEYLIKNNRGLITEPEENVISLFGGENWQKLAEMIQKSNNLKHEEQILTAMKSATDPDETKREIKELYPEDYQIIESTMFPELAGSEVMIYVSRPEMMAADSVHSEYRSDYAEGVRLLMNRQYWEALEILNQYPDYNLALCLTCMGYNGKAYDVLEQLQVNANVEYLKAIVLVRLDREEQAAEHLLNACNLDIVKLSRAELDSETQGLLYKYNIKERVYESQARVEDNGASVEEGEANVEENEASVEGSEANIEKESLEE